MGRRVRVVLGIDPATQTGYGLLRGRRRVLSGSFVMPKTKAGEHPGWRYQQFLGHLNVDLNRCTALAHPDLLVIEWARNMRGGDAMAMHGWIRAELLMWARRHGIEVGTVNPTDVKTHATGKGDASKAEMFAEACKRFRYHPESDDETDALWIADYGRVNL